MKNRLDGIPPGNPRKAFVVALLLGITNAQQLNSSLPLELEDPNFESQQLPEEMDEQFYEARNGLEAETAPRN